MTGTQLVTNAFLRARIIQGNETPEGTDLNYALTLLNTMLADWSSQTNPQWALNVVNFSGTVAGQANYTIGPSGDIIISARPVDISSVQFTLSPSPIPVTPNLKYVPFSQYQGFNLKALPGVPEYYSVNPTIPNWTIYLYPTPVLGYPLTVTYYAPLADASPNTVYTFPPGMEFSIIANLACQLRIDWDLSPDPLLMQIAVNSKNHQDAQNQARQAQSIGMDPSAPGMGAGSSQPEGWLSISPFP